MAGQLSQECEPYILPLFGAHTEALMGRNVSWLCKALGSRDLELYWRLPQSIHDEDPVDQGTNRYLGCVHLYYIILFSDFLTWVTLQNIFEHIFSPINPKMVD